MKKVLLLLCLTIAINSFAQKQEADHQQPAYREDTSAIRDVFLAYPDGLCFAE